MIMTKLKAAKQVNHKATLGHSEKHGGLRGHSLGEFYPLGIYKKGSVYQLANLITGKHLAKSWDYSELEAIALGHASTCKPLTFNVYDDLVTVVIPKALRSTVYGIKSCTIDEVKTIKADLLERVKALRLNLDSVEVLPELIQLANLEGFLDMVEDAVTVNTL